MSVMKSLDEIVKERPYLKEIIRLYSHLSQLNDIADDLSKEPVEEWTNYPEAWAERIVGVITDTFGMSAQTHEALVKVLTWSVFDLRRVPVEETELLIEGIGNREAKILLYLYSKAFLMAERKRINLDGVFWDEGRCPVCSGVPAVSIIEPEQKRQFYCNYCGTVGPYYRLTCPVCHKDHSKGLEIVMLEGQEGIRADICPECKSYWKSFDTHMLKDYTYELLDIISLPIDIALQDRGYHRGCPNPIGMKDVKEG